MGFGDGLLAAARRLGRMMNLTTLPVVALVVAMCCSLPFLVDWLSTRMFNSVTDDAYVKADMVDLAPQVDGQIVEMLVVDGDLVSEGQLLCRIDPNLYQRQVEIDRARLALARSELKVAEESLRFIADSAPRSVSLAEAQTAAAVDVRTQTSLNVDYMRDKVASGIELAGNEKASATAALALANELLEHRNKLGPSGAVSLEDWDRKKIAAQERTSELAAAVSRVALAKSGEKRLKVMEQKVKTADVNVQVAQRSEELRKSDLLKIDEAKARVAQKTSSAEAAKSQLDLSLAYLSYTEIKAPFTGYIGKRLQFKGDFAAKGTAIFSMYRSDDVYISANLEETKLRGVAVGNPATVKVDAFSEPFKGRVYLVGRAAESQFALIPRNISSGEFTRVIERVEIRMRVDKDDPRIGKLRPGLSTYVVISHKRAGGADTAAD